MKIAISIGSYSQPDFVRLNVACLQAIPEFFGAPILINDDVSLQSRRIEAFASALDGVNGLHLFYERTDAKAGHFAGDALAFVNGLAFARDMEADILIKISQRLMLLPYAGKHLISPFEKPIALALPPSPPKGSLLHSAEFFSSMPLLTDVVAIRVSELPAEEFVERYRHLFTTSTDRRSALIEYLFEHLISEKFKDRVAWLGEFAEHKDTPLYLRKSQNRPEEYKKLALEHGINGEFNLGEWKEIEGTKYRPRPLTV